MKKILKGIFTTILLAIFGIGLFYIEEIKLFIDDVFKDDDHIIVYDANQDENGFYYFELDEDDKYYSSIKGVDENDLFTSLNKIMSKKQLISYGDARYALEKADRHLTEDGVWNIYDGSLGPSKWDSRSWHREHVWPNSRLGINRVSNNQKNIGSDLHNLRAIVPSVNSSRSNFYYDESQGENHVIKAGESYYPGDEHKGDVARIILYMAVTYDNLTLTDEDLALKSGEAYTDKATKMGKLSVLLKWHKEDPVDDFERQRNDVIYEYQKNRNPFIDYPGLVHLIWEDKTYEDLKYPVEDLSSPSIENFYTYYNYNWRMNIYAN